MSTRLRTPPRRRRRAARLSVAALAALLAAVSLSACGSADTRETTGTYSGLDGAAAPYLSVGGLVYQVQISRALNPYDTEDRAYLKGLAPVEGKLSPGEEWLGVFMQVYNETGKPHRDASHIVVYDTEGNTYSPVATKSYNLYQYRPGTVAAKAQIPTPSSTAANGPTNGAMLLYKIKTESLENRPLTIKIFSPSSPSETASAELDV